MSSSEEYLDSLLDSILGGGDAKESSPEKNEEAVSEENRNVEAGKAMSPAEIEEMLVSMGTLGGGEEEATETDTADTAADDMEAMLAFMNEQSGENADVSATEEAAVDDMSMDDISMDEMPMEELSLDDISTDEMPMEELSLNDLTMEETGVEDTEIEDSIEADLGLEEIPAEDVSMDEMSLDEMSLDDISTDEMPMEELSVDDISMDEMPMEELSVDDISMDEMPMEELSLDDISMDEMPMEELSLSDISMDEMPMEELSLSDLSMEETGVGDTEIEDSIEADLGLEEIPAEDASMEEMSLDEMSLDDITTDEMPMEELSLDDISTDEMPMEELSLDDISTDEMPMEELSLDDISTDEMPMEELSLDDLSMEKTGMEDTEIEDSIEADLGLEEIPAEDASMEELSLDDLSLDEETIEETGDSALEDMDGMMSEEDIDRLLNGDSMEGEETSSEDFALEESGDGEEELSDLLAGMDHDEDLSEINDLLEESQQGMPADDDLLAMLEGTPDGDDGSFDFFESDEAAREAEGIRELSPEEVAARENNGEEKPKKEKKKRKKLFGKKKDSAEAAAGGAEGGLEDAAGQDTPKKPGFFAKLMDFLLESDEDEDPLTAEILGDNGGATGTVTDENQELLNELSEEDKKGKKKKKKEKKKKDKKEGEEKEKKPKKPKKEKKKKPAPEVDPLAPPEKKLSKKKVFTVFLFCGTIGAGIIVLTSYLPDYLQIQDAHIAYDNNEYAEVYDLLYGIERSDQDEILFQRSNLILQMRRKVASYENYVNLNMQLEALNALISGVERYHHILPEAEQYNVVDEVSATYAQILGLLSTDFGVSESEALEIIALKDDVEYTQWLERILSGSTYSEEEGTSATLDILPEEEEILERLEGLQEEQQDIMPEEELEIDGDWNEGSEE